MKKIIFFTAMLIVAMLSRAQKSGKDKDCDLGVTINQSYSKATTLDSILKVYSISSLPGTAIAVYTEKEGWWASARGYANVEKKNPIQNCHLQYLQSVSKTYMAVEILQLKEEGKILLEAPITKYLPAKYSRYIKDADKITVRMLLNHQSGVPEYNSNPNFVSYVILHPSNNFSADDMLKSFDGEALQFAPGSKYQYTNTNYLLLSLIGDAITGDHAAYIKKHIFEPLGLHNTYYALNHTYLDGLNIPDSYWDVLNSGRPANITGLQKMTVACSKGDDGIVCTPVDAVKFLKGLTEGKFLSETSLNEMLDFVKDEKGNKRYGMGMIYFDIGGIPAYGHGGGGIGAGCGLVYIPSHKTYLFIATNLGVLIDGDLSKKADEMRNAILLTLLQ